MGILELQRYCNYLLQEHNLALVLWRQQYHGIQGLLAGRTVVGLAS